jgi:hypothetical protein
MGGPQVSVVRTHSGSDVFSLSGTGSVSVGLQQDFSFLKRINELCYDWNALTQVLRFFPNAETLFRIRSGKKCWIRSMTLSLASLYICRVTRFVAWARISKPFKGPRNRFPACRAGTTSLFWRTGSPGYKGRRNRFLGSFNDYKFGLRLSSCNP